MQLVADRLRLLCEVDGCYITAWDPFRQAIAPLVASGPHQADYINLPPLADKNTFSSAVLQAGRVVVVHDSAESIFNDVRIVQLLQVKSLLGIPLQVDKQKIGAIMFAFFTPHEFTAEEMWQAEQVMLPISLAVARAQLLHQEKEQRAIANALQEAGTVISSTLDFEEVLDRILEQIERVVPYDSANIMLMENGRAQVVRHRGYAQTNPWLIDELMNHQLDIRQALTFRTIMETKRPYIVQDVATFPDWIGKSEDIRSWAGVPILVADEIVAFIGVDKVEPNFYQPQHVTLLTAFANQVAIALQNAQLHKATKRQIEELSVLHALTSAAVEVESEAELLERATQIIGDTLYTHNFGILLFDQATQMFHVPPSYRIQIDLPESQFPISQGIAGQVARSQRPYRASQVADDPYYMNADEMTQSQLCVPLFLGNQLIGVVNAESRVANGFSDSDEHLLTTFARQLGIAIEKIRLIAGTQRQAEESRLVSNILRLLNTMSDVTLVFPQFSQGIKELTDCTAVTLILSNYQLREPKIVSPDIPILQQYTEQILADTAVFEYGQVGQIDTVADLNSLTPNTLQQLLFQAGYASSLTLPLYAGPNPIGVLNLAWLQPTGYHNTPLTRFNQVATALALALQRSQLFEEIRAHQLAMLQNLSREIAGLVEERQIYSKFAEHLHHYLNYQSVSIYSTDLEKEEVVCEAIVGPHQQMIPIGLYRQKLGEGLIGQAAQTGETLIVNDTEAHPNFVPSPRIRVRSELVIPFSHSAAQIGVLNVDSVLPNAFSGNDVAILTIAADQLAAAIERAHLLQQMRDHAQNLEKRNRDLVVFNEVGQILVATFDRYLIYRAIFQRIVQPLMQVSHFAIVLLDGTTQLLHYDYLVVDDQEREPTLFAPTPIGEDVAGQVLQSRHGRIVDLVPPLINATAPLSSQRPARSGLYVPLISGGEVLGVMYMISAGDEPFKASELSLFSTLATQVSVAIEKSHLFEEIELRASKLEALSTLSAELRTAEDIHAMLPIILQRAMGVAGGVLGSLYLKERQTGDMVSYGVYPFDEELIGRRFKVGEGIIGYIAATGDIHITKRMDQSEMARFYEKERQLVEKGQIRSGIGLPLHAQERIIGVMYLNLAQEHTFTAEEIDFLVAICEIAGGALDRMLLLQTLEDRVNERTHALGKANEQLKQLDRLKSKFVSDVSHELRTPITNLSLYLDLFGRSKPEKQGHYLTVLRKQVDRLAQLIEDILSLSRLELGRNKVQFVPLGLNLVVATAVDAMAPRLAETNLTLSQKLWPELPQIVGEPNQLSLLVTHLLTNAVQHTLAGTIQIHTGQDWDKGFVFLSVQDTGQGINSADLPHLFERFYRGRNASQLNIPGTGLGLSIVKEIVEIHGGQTEVSSQEGVGTTFTIWLPMMAML